MVEQDRLARRQNQICQAGRGVAAKRQARGASEASEERSWSRAAPSGPSRSQRPRPPGEVAPGQNDQVASPLDAVLPEQVGDVDLRRSNPGSVTSAAERSESAEAPCSAAGC